jgi:hypothetical protein
MLCNSVYKTVLRMMSLMTDLSQCLEILSYCDKVLRKLMCDGIFWATYTY